MHGGDRTSRIAYRRVLAHNGNIRSDRWAPDDGPSESLDNQRVWRRCAEAFRLCGCDRRRLRGLVCRRDGGLHDRLHRQHDRHRRWHLRRKPNAPGTTSDPPAERRLRRFRGRRRPGRAAARPNIHRRRPRFHHRQRPAGRIRDRLGNAGRIASCLRMPMAGSFFATCGPGRSGSARAASASRRSTRPSTSRLATPFISRLGCR